MVSSAEKLDCEFTLALNNHTGKYFFCKDMIDASNDMINSVYDWRFSFGAPPSRTISRILGRLALIEVSIRTRWPSTYMIWPPILRPRIMLFTDPRDCVLSSSHTCYIALCHATGPPMNP